MYTLSKTVVLAMLALSASALTTPRHGAAHYGRHHAIARNVPADETSVPAAIPREIRRRSTSRRCKPRTSSSFVPSSTILIADPTPSSEAPEPTTSSKVPEPTTSSKAPEPTTSSKAAEPTTSSKAPEPTTSSKVPEPTTSSKAAEPTTSSKAPEPTTSSKAAPTTSTKEPETTQAPTTTKVTTTAQATTTASSGDGPSYLFGTQSGDGTFYATGLGACGITNNDSQYIVAVSKLLFDSYPNYSGANPNNNPVCNKQIKASRNGKSVTVTVTDRCEACKMTDLDFSPAAFDQLGDQAEGRIPITWVWV